MNEKVTLADRKKDHLDMSLESQLTRGKNDTRFYYEPALGTLKPGRPFYQKEFQFLGKSMRAPLWVGSMTGGTKEAFQINSNLARACSEFGLGMGLGSCRPLLEGRQRWEDFNFRDIIGNDLPFYANFGIAQIYELLKDNNIEKLNDLVGELRADGLIIHLNPAQEWFQPEGDAWDRPAISIIEEALSLIKYPVIVKEVGQGMGPASLEAFMNLPLAAIEFGAFGGTNFSYLEMKRGENSNENFHENLCSVGHPAEEMVLLINSIKSEKSSPEFIISGGLRDYLDGFYLMSKLEGKAVYGHAARFLKYARGDYQDLKLFVEEQLRGLEFANQFLKIKD